jgi:hypothetical protein
VVSFRTIGKRNATAVALAALVVFAGLSLVVALKLSDDFPSRAGTPRTDEDAVVQAWWRREISRANVTGCRDTGVPDFITDGSIWACELWYVDPDRRSTVCVVMDERIVHRRIRRDLPGGIACA